MDMKGSSLSLTRKPIPPQIKDIIKPGWMKMNESANTGNCRKCKPDTGPHTEIAKLSNKSLVEMLFKQNSSIVKTEAGVKPQAKDVSGLLDCLNMDELKKAVEGDNKDGMVLVGITKVKQL